MTKRKCFCIIGEVWLGVNYADLTSDNDVKLMNRILDMLDDDDDVQEVYHNWNQPEEEDED